MKELGLALITVEPLNQAITNPQIMKDLANTMLSQDVHLYYGRPSPTLINRVSAVNKMKPGKGGIYNEMRYPPDVFFTLDDNYDMVSPFNESFLYNGFKLPDGTQIMPGDEVKCQLVDGTVVTLWKEGAYYGAEKFDAERNRQAVGQMNRVLGHEIAGSYFTTDRLTQHYTNNGFKNAYTYPNSILFDDYQNLKDYRMVRNDPKKVKVLWQGGSSHYEDWYAIRAELKELTQLFPEVEWVIWGTKFPWIHDVIPSDRLTFIPWMPYEAYKMILQTLDFDFMVAPLSENLFNEGKSAIKFYEPAAMFNPKPTLAAAVPPYSDEIIDGQTGLLWKTPKEFIEKFGMMVQNAQLRNELAMNANTWLHENRDAMKTTIPFYEWLRDTREAKKKKWGGQHGLADLLAKAGQPSGNPDNGQAGEQSVSGEGASAGEQGALEPELNASPAGAL